MRVELFEGQLHIAVIVIVVKIIAPIMHGKKIGKAYFIVALLMLGKMLKQHGEL